LHDGDNGVRSGPGAVAERHEAEGSDGVNVLQEAPACVCRQCGEALLEAEAVSGIQDVLRAVDERVGKLRHAA
jgi:hypothetical protein